MADNTITKEMLDKLLELGKIGQEEYKKLSRLQAIMMAEKKPTEFIYDELQAIKEKFADIAENTKGIKEIDLKKIKGARGETGDKGERGEQGKQGIQGIKGEKGQDGKTPVAGKDFPLPKNGKDGLNGKDGKSIVGDKGDKPDHKWEGTKLKFEKPNGKWGKAIDLKGKDGKSGSSFFGGGLFSVATDSTLSGDGTLNNPLSVQSAGASAFTSLTDVPSSYTGQGTKFVRVNGAETALEFATVSGGGDALTSAPLSQFAATTSSQLKGVISDETGSGALVFADTPTLVTPVLGAATGTSLQLSGLTASELLSTDASKNLTSLAVATYPSLAEIAYVKGVTSAIQTQLNAKQATLVSGTNIKTINGTTLLGSGDIVISGTIDGSGTANELAYWTDSDTLGTLAVATYPSLTELSYIKGLTSAVQTQINTKAPSTAPTFATSITGSYLTASEILITDGSKNIVSAAVATYPSLTELTYLKGVTSAIQTQINTKANSSGALTQFVGNGNYKVFYSDGSGDITELALGADGTFLKSNGASSAPSFATPAGSGDVSKVGTPVNNQIGVWTGDGTIEGDAALTFDTTTDTLATTLITATTVTANLTGNVTGNASGTAATVTAAAQPAITSVGTLTTLTVDNININGNTIISTDTDGNINLTPNGTGKNVLANAQVTSLTASEIVITDASKNLVSAAVATYPSLTELTYLKGVTSAIQTQINNKQPLDADLTTIAGLTATSDNFLQAKSSAWASRTPTQVTADLIAFVGDSGSGGNKGLVPAPTTGDATKFLKGDGTWGTVSGGGDALTSNPLSQFAATTSSQLAGVISDETGSGALVFATSPTFTTPVLGVATATSINKVAITAPATSATLTIADGKTLTTSNTITLTATDGSTLAIGAGGTLGSAAYTASSAYEVPLTFSTGLTRSTNTITVNTTQNIAKLSNLTSNGFVKTSGGDGTLSVDTNTYLTSLTGAVLTDQTVGQTIGATGARLTKLWATDITVTNAIAGSITGNAATVTNATLTTALTVNTGTVTLTGNVANTSVLTIGAGAVSVSGSNTGDQTTVSGNAGTATALQNARTIGGVSFDGTANITVATATGGFTVSGGNLALTTNSITMTGSLASTGARVTKGWFTDIESTNAPTVGGSAVYYAGGTDVAVADGGTGKSSWTQYLIPYADTTTSFSQIAIGTAGQVLTSNGAGAAPTFQAAAGGGITVGTTTITSGTNTRILYNNSGVVGEYTLTGTGTVVVMQNTPTLTTPVINGVSTGTGVSNTATVSTLALRNSSANLLANNFSENYTSTATTGGTTTLVVGDAGMMAFTGTSTQDINLPVTSTLTVGHKYKIVNKSTISVRVFSSGGNTMAMVGPQQTLVFTCISTSGTSGTSWHFDAGFRWYELANGTNANQITVGNYGSGIAGALGNVGTSGRNFLISAPATSGSLILNTNSTDRVTILSTGQTGFGQSTPTAVIHLKAGTTAASSAPLKFTSGSLNTTAEAGAVEFLTDAFYGTITTGAARKTFAFLESPAFTTPNLGTPSAGTLTNCTGLPVAGITASTSTALGVGSIELGHASDTTISRSSAGVIAVESVVIPSISSTNTLTNKRITKRTGTTTSSATPTINTDNVDFYSLTAQTADITSFTTNLSGTPTEGQTLWIAITGTAARAITWGSSFEASTIALPTTTVTTNRLDVGFVWNTVTSKFRCIAAC